MIGVKNQQILLLGNSYIFSDEGIFSELHTSEFTTPHYHTYYELVVMFKGEIEHLYTSVADQPGYPSTLPKRSLYGEFPDTGLVFARERLKLGDIQIIPPWICHRYAFVDPRSEYVNVTISAPLFAELTRHLNADRFSDLPKKITVHSDKIAAIREQFLETEQQMNLGEKDRAALNKILVMNVLKNFLTDETMQKAELPQWLKELIVLINNPNYYAFSVEEIVAGIPYSHSYICKHFKAAFGISLKHYLTNKKLEHACYLLKHTDLKIVSIANLIGYGNQGFFANVFFNRYGMTPFDYRKKTS